MYLYVMFCGYLTYTVVLIHCKFLLIQANIYSCNIPNKHQCIQLQPWIKVVNNSDNSAFHFIRITDLVIPWCANNRHRYSNWYCSWCLGGRGWGENWQWSTHTATDHYYLYPPNLGSHATFITCNLFKLKPSLVHFKCHIKYCRIMVLCSEYVFYHGN